MKLDYSDRPDGKLHIELRGEMDAPACSGLRSELEQILDTGNQAVVAMDLANVSFIDSSGIGVIVYLYKSLKANDRTLEIINVQGQPRELFELLRIGTAIPVRPAPEPTPSSENNPCAV